MATRLRKTRKYRGSRNHGWGQVGQHRASGHKGGLGQAGYLKHYFSSMLKYDLDHFGHDSIHPPRPNITKKWTNVRDLDDLFAKFGYIDGEKKIIDLKGYDKLLGGGKITNTYTIRVEKFTVSAEQKIKKAGGEVLKSDG